MMEKTTGARKPEPQVGNARSLRDDSRERPATCFGGTLHGQGVSGPTEVACWGFVLGIASRVRFESGAAAKFRALCSRKRPLGFAERLREIADMAALGSLSAGAFVRVSSR
jgi:hypothetical protein